MKWNVASLGISKMGLITLIATTAGFGARCISSNSSSLAADSGQTGNDRVPNSGGVSGSGDGSNAASSGSSGALGGVRTPGGSSSAADGSTGPSGSGGAVDPSGVAPTTDGSSGGTGPVVFDAGTDSTSGSGGGATDSSSGSGNVDVNPSALPGSTLWLVGDSTVAINTTGTALEGWGQEIAQFFVSTLTITNQAEGGRSVQSFMYSDTANTVETTRWASIKANIRAGDFLTVQFGANDSSGIVGRAVTPADFETLLGSMVDAVKAKGATPILITPSALQIWVNGMETNTRLAPYVAAMIDLGPKKGVLVDDLNARSVAYVGMLGQTSAQQVYFQGDKAHFTKYGATEIARMVTEELRRMNSPLAAYLK